MAFSRGFVAFDGWQSLPISDGCGIPMLSWQRSSSFRRLLEYEVLRRATSLAGRHILFIECFDITQDLAMHALVLKSGTNAIHPWQ